MPAIFAAKLIVTGFVAGEPYILVIERDCTVTQRENVACIGTGAYIAKPALYQISQNRSVTLARTLYQCIGGEQAWRDSGGWRIHSNAGNRSTKKHRDSFFADRARRIEVSGREI